MAKVFIISDTHLPFQNKRAFKKMLELIKAEKPTVVVHIGDLLDQYVFSKYTKSLAVTADLDMTLGLKQAEEMWATIKKLSPKAQRIQVLGNHDVRLAKRISEKLPELEGVMDPLGAYKFKGVKVLKSYRDHVEIDGVIYTHGYLTKSIDHAKHFGKPVVHGHLHRPGISTFGKLWTMDVGHLADETSLPLSYTQSKVTNWRMAVGIVEAGLPRLVLL